MSRFAKLRAEFAIHSLARVSSGLLSFYLFSLIARLYLPDDSKLVYQFLFVVGFAAAAVRSVALISAKIDPDATQASNLRRVYRAFAHTSLVACLIAPVVGWILWHGGVPPAAAVLGGLCLTLCGIDADLTRSVLRRPPWLAVTFAIGTGMGLLLLLVPAHPSITAGCMALLLPWLLVGVLNLGVAWRSRAQIRHSRLNGERDRHGHLASITCIALFDGAILNLPFLLGENLSSQLMVEIAIVIRVFSASLVFFPLALHWSNSGMLQVISRRLGWCAPRSYFLVQFILTLLVGACFTLAFGLIAKVGLTVHQYTAFTLLAIAYCAYSTSSRFGTHWRRTLAVAVLLTLVFAVAALLLFVPASQLSVLVVASSQSMALLIAAWCIRTQGGLRTATNRD